MNGAEKTARAGTGRDRAGRGGEPSPEVRFVMVKPLPPPPGDGLCRALTGQSEAAFAQDILAGRYGKLWSPRPD